MPPVTPHAGPDNAISCIPPVISQPPPLSPQTTSVFTSALNAYTSLTPLLFTGKETVITLRFHEAYIKMRNNLTL